MPSPVSSLPILAIVVPCFNEEAVLPDTVKSIDDLLASLVDGNRIAEGSFALYVDDGSKDATWSIIAGAHKKNSRVKGVRFGGNAGHQSALIAGMATVRPLADCAVTLDADLQDDIGVIADMLEAYRKGDHLVYGVRANRAVDTYFKRTTANVFYKIMDVLGAPILPGHADFRLVSKFAMESLEGYGEKTLFLRSIFPSMKLRSSSVYYERKMRTAGETKYPFWKMVSFALGGITSSSPAPLRLAALLSLFTFFLAILQSISALMAYFAGQTLPGWTSLMLIILYLGAVQLFCTAILGEYLAKIFTEVKRRPRYRVEQELL